jgi:hypothetical protein
VRDRSGSLPLRFFLPLILLAFFIYWKHVFWDNLLPCDGDTLRLVYPSWSIVRDHLSHFQSLLWDPLRNMGQPLLASPPAQVLYPLQWISPFIGFVGYSKIFIAAHTALVLFYGRKLFLALHNDEATAWLGAMALGFNGLMLDKASVHCDLAAMSWIPACFYYLHRRRPLQLGACLALQWFAGLPTYSILTGVMMGAFALASERRGALLRVLCQGGAAGAGLAAIQWIPFLECLRQSQRGVLLGKDMATQFSSSPIELIRGLIVPSAAAPALPVASSSDPAVSGFFVGPFLSALFVCGAWRGGAAARRIAALTVVALLLALGNHLHFYARIPFITIFRFPSLWLVPATFGLIWVACAGFRSLPSARQRVLLLAVAVDLLIYSLNPLTGYADAAFITSTTLRPEKLQNIPTGTRLFHTWDITSTVHRWQLRGLNDWYVFKGMLVPSIGAAYGLAEVESRSQLISRRHVEFLVRINRAEPGSPLLAEARVSRIVTLAPGAASKPMPEKSDIRIIENTGLRPRFSMDNGRPVEVQRDQPGSLACTAQGPGRLVVYESYFPGWTATADGRALEVKPFDQTFLSVNVPPGPQTIVLKYRPWSFYAGAAISALTLLLIALAVVF